MTPPLDMGARVMLFFFFLALISSMYDFFTKLCCEVLFIEGGKSKKEKSPFIDILMELQFCFKYFIGESVVTVHFKGKADLL